MEEDPGLPAWDEPTNVQDLTDRYVIESKVAGRTPGSTLYVVQAKARNGAVTEVAENQTYKLFLVA